MLNQHSALFADVVSLLVGASSSSVIHQLSDGSSDALHVQSLSVEQPSQPLLGMPGEFAVPPATQVSTDSKYFIFSLNECPFQNFAS